MHISIFTYPSRPARFLGLCLATAVALVNGGCAFNGAVNKSEPQSTNTVDASETHTGGSASPGGDGADWYLTTITEFNSADKPGREVLYERASLAAALKASAHHRLQLALLKLSPGHHGYNPRAAETLLRSVTEKPDDLSAGAVNLAALYLKLTEEYNRLRLVNTDLEKRLREANAKLEKLKQIERSVDPPADESLDQPKRGTADE